MRLLLVNNLFQPEPNHLKGLAFAKELRRRGHEVHVLTGFPNYPGGRVYDGYRLRWTMREEIEGIPVTRVALFPSHDGSALRRVASYVSLGLSQALHAPFLPRFDLCHVYLGPPTLLWAAAVMRALHRAKIVADVQDIWPESVTDSGMLRSGVAARALAAWCRHAYAAADRLVVLSRGYKRALTERGIAADRIEVVHNWCDERDSGDAAIPEEVLRPGAFNVVYAGNIGRLQGIDTILDAAKCLAGREPPVRFVLVGDGVDADRIKRRIAAEGIRNVSMTGRVPVQLASAIQRRADLLVVHVKPSPLTSIGIPQKVQAYLASGTPVVLAATGDSAELVERSGGGTTCAPDDPAALAAAVERMVGLGVAARRGMGAAGAAFYARELSFTRGVDAIERLFSQLVEGSASQWAA